MKALTTAILTVTLLSGITDQITHPAAKTALNQHKSALAIAQREYEAKVKAADRQLITKLDKALKDATQKGHLDEALRIRAAKQAVGSNKGIDHPLSGTTWSWGPIDKMTFNADGTAGKLKWKPIDGRRVVVMYSNGAVDMLVFDKRFKTMKYIVGPRPDAIPKNIQKCLD